MFNKKLLITLSLHTVAGFILLLPVRLLTESGYISTETYVINSIITAIALIISLIFTLFYYKTANSEKIHIIDIAFPLIFALLLYLLYIIPPLDFIGVKGINNSVLSAFFFLISGQYLHNIAFYINSKKEQPKISNISKPTYRQNTSGMLITKDGIKFNTDIIRFAGFMFWIAGVFVAIFNIFKPVIDLTMIFQNF